jgi:hypothetical protein
LTWAWSSLLFVGAVGWPLGRFARGGWAVMYGLVLAFAGLFVWGTLLRRSASGAVKNLSVTVD